MSDKKNLFPEFSPTSKDQWLEKVTKELKGRLPEDLTWSPNSSITLSPFYHLDDAIPATDFPTPAHNNWAIGEDITIDQDYAAANRQLLQALQLGVDAPVLHLQHSPSSADWAKLLHEVEPSYIQLRLAGAAAQTQPLAVLEGFLAHLQAQGQPSSTLRGGIQSPATQAGTLQALCEEALPLWDYISFSSDAPTQSEQLSDLIHQAHQCLKAGHSPAALHFQLALDTSYFPAMAKIRALRLLWANVLQAYGIPLQAARISCIFNPSTYVEDPNTNLIRATTLAMSAVIGSTDILVVRPTEREDEQFARRLARNLQHILKMESYLDRVIDPGAGSYYIESLTRQLAAAAWQGFQALVQPD